MKVCVAIDPGIVTVGYAIFKSSMFRPGKECPRPVAAGAHVLPGRLKRSAPETNALRMVAIVERVIRAYRVEQVWCERMEFRSTAAGLAAVNDILGVQFACGAYAKLAEQIGAAYHPAPVSQWKGQLSKQQVVDRVLKRWNHNTDPGRNDDTLEFLSSFDYPSHDWDAVGIGLWGAGWF